jgi:hypothetical protein
MKLAAAVVTVLAVVGIPALADWSDNFDSYPADTKLEDVGGWWPWNHNTLNAGWVRTTYFRSAPNSQEIADVDPADPAVETDSVREYTGYTSGKWIYTAWQYLPETYFEFCDSYFIILNTYDWQPPNTDRWSVQIGFNGYTGMLHADAGGTVPIQMPLVKGQWMEIKAVINLDLDWVDVYYGGTLINGYVWTHGIFGQDTDGRLNIAAVDLYANNTAVPAYYDDITLMPAVTILRADCNCSGTVDAFDIDPFVLGLTNFAGWQAAYPNCPWQNLDIDCNGAINAFDIDPFVYCLTSGTGCAPCP